MSFATIGGITSLVTAGTGLARVFGSGKDDRQSELEKYAKQSPLAKESKSLNDYYQQALNRYNENPYQSQQYKVGAMNARQATAQGINALQDRRSAIGGIGRLATGQQMAMQNLGMQAEAQKNARFSQLGQATQAKTEQDRYLFDINQMTPYNRELQLKQYKAQAAADENAAGWGMVGSGISNLASLGIMGKGLGTKGAKVNAVAPDMNAELNSFMTNRKGIDLSGMGAKLPTRPEYFGANTGNLYGSYGGADYLTTLADLNKRYK